MGLLRFILWSIIFYFIIKTFKSISKALKTNDYKNDKEPIYYQKHYNKEKIDEKDIIDADYEDLTPPKKN